MHAQTILILPGWQDSGPQHWQSLWLKKYPNAVKVEQKDWMYPKKEKWVAVLNDFVQQYKNKDIVFVGHSLACATIAYWSNEYFSQGLTIKGALFVSPSDVDQKDFPKEIFGFSPMPLKPLNFKTIVVASDNDPFVTVDRATYFSRCWGGKLVNIGPQGHINADAGFGEWPQGEQLLKELLQQNYAATHHRANAKNR